MSAQMNTKRQNSHERLHQNSNHQNINFIPDQALESHFPADPSASLSFTGNQNPSMDIHSFPQGDFTDPNGRVQGISQSENSYAFTASDLANQNFLSQSNNYLQQPDMIPLSQAQSTFSPSGSITEQLSSEGYLSDPNYADYNSHYTTPTFDDQFLDTQFGPMLNLDDTNPSDYDNNYLTTSTQISDMNDTSSLQYQSTHHIPPAPGLKNESFSSPPHATTTQLPPADPFQTNGSMLANAPLNARLVTSNKQQHSPARTESPASSSLASGPIMAAHLVSPIVRVENYSREESPSRGSMNRSRSKRSHGSKRSGTHLSPYPVDDSSDEEEQLEPTIDLTTSTSELAHVVQPTLRNDDGSWRIPSSSGQAGLDPDTRHQLADVYVPTLKEQEEQRKADEKKLEVAEWLTRSKVGSETGEPPPPDPGVRSKKIVNRRRAKSANDVAIRETFNGTSGIDVQTMIYDDSKIPGPGLYIDERSDFGEDYDNDADDQPDSPPADVEVEYLDEDSGYFPSKSTQDSNIPDSSVTRPWIDATTALAPHGGRYQPPTSNAAMMKFWQRARDIETASLAATLGSARRRSESEIGSVYASGGISRQLIPEPERLKPKEPKRERRGSFLDNILPKRTNSSNVLKRKGTLPTEKDLTLSPTASIAPKRVGSWGRPKSPRIDTNLSSSSKEGTLGSAVTTTTPSGAWNSAKNVIRRSRSRSDIGKGKGLKELMEKHGGPPMLALATPNDPEKPPMQPSNAKDSDDDNDDDALGQDAITMDLTVRSDPIIPTLEGFKDHARELNPRLEVYMIERITQEQIRRYKRLLEFRVKHMKAIRNGKCSSGKFCTALGGSSVALPPRVTNKDSEAPFIGFQIIQPGCSDEDIEVTSEGTIVAAQFPAGVPLPPVKRLPAEFECPLCFKVKKFYKPSDWTKHVHEDVQPFTCTFPSCGEPKSFKRKADWVRHENERHRQLENWTCNYGECTHTCYRKDNFVQHLVREHKIPEPKARTGKTANAVARDGPRTASDEVWDRVESCRRDTTKQPKDERCRFCGNICNSWKKLTVHLAKHMEQISMPILTLVDQRQISADTIISPIDALPYSSVSPVAKTAQNPSAHSTGYLPQYNISSSNPTSRTNLTVGYTPFGTGSSTPVSAGSMHTYPPPQFVSNYKPQTAAQQSNYSYPVQAETNYAIHSYPGLNVPSKPQTLPANAFIAQEGHSNYSSNINGRFVPSITPIRTAYGQQQVYSSPVDTTPFGGNDLPSTYFQTNVSSTSMATSMSGVDQSSLGYNQNVNSQVNHNQYQAVPQYIQPHQQQQQQQQQHHDFLFRGQ
ncbi:hypothetical protein M501DRAFT_238718 [Patellaria atrata CBS 101060]|uniref:C2H2-type domain-containing protein n=1 Tax=Patellaria atrata CBS 101060 TaxID=1346257 RepID=A0A9P4S5B7_9PEZI|nr:hypothetical protein M501DRAFT_238718 [Patellaria atrata CBS 101060]